MTQYIDKSALVAELERRINELNPDNIEDWRYRLQREHDIELLKSILSLINTLEVKEIGVYIGSPEGDICVKTIWDGDKIVSSKAQKGE